MEHVFLIDYCSFHSLSWFRNLSSLVFDVVQACWYFKLVQTPVMYEMFDKKNIKSTKNLLIRIVSILAVRRLFFFFFFQAMSLSFLLVWVQNGDWLVVFCVFDKWDFSITFLTLQFVDVNMCCHVYDLLDSFFFIAVDIRGLLCWIRQISILAKNNTGN